MKSSLPTTFLLAALALSTPLRAQSPAPTTPAASVPPAAPATSMSEDEKAAYALGVNIAGSLRRDGIQVDAKALTAGLRDGMGGGPLQMTQDQVVAALHTLQQKQTAKMQETKKAAADANAAEGTKFLAENKAKPGVTVLPDGLQYKVLTQGTGATPKATDTVTVNYRGTLINGTEFDSSYKRNEPVSFAVNGVIPGWTEVLQLMKVGSKYQVFIPGNLAYGERGAGADIGPNATLIFEVELLSIK